MAIPAGIEDICGSYALSHFNGKPTDVPASLHFARDGNNLNAFISVANSMNAKVRYEDGRISGMLLSTMLMGNPSQMALEAALSGGFGTGFQVKVEHDKFLMKNENNSLLWKRTMQLEDLFGEHAIISVDEKRLSEEVLIKFLPDGAGGTFVVANLTNSLRGQCQVLGGLLKGEVATTDITPSSEMAFAEERIKVGLSKGYNMRKNRIGIILRSEKTSMQLCQVVSCSNLCGEFLLKTFNGVAVPTTKQSTITFSQEDNSDLLKVFIVVGNRIRGTAKLFQNVLKSDDPLMSTRSKANDEEARVEAAYNSGFQYGLEAVLKGKGARELILRCGDNEFMYTRVATVDAELQGPTYKGTYFQKCFRTQGNGLLFRVVNDHENRWAYYNDTKDYRMHIQATFGSRSEIKPIGKAKMSKKDGKYIVETTVEPQDTEMFIEGEVNGFKVLYNAEPVE